MRHTHSTEKSAFPGLSPAAEQLAGAAVAALLAVLLGLFILYGVALAQPEILHNAAHDARHAFAFPCH
jgi:cobalt transporter subunit CbtB